MKKYFFLTLLLISGKYFVAQAQDFSDYDPNNTVSFEDFINNSFSELDTTQFPTDVFYNRTFGMSDLFYLQGNQNDSITNYEKNLVSYLDINTASKRKYNSQKIRILDSAFKQDLRRNNLINFLMQNYNYHYIKKVALDSSLLSFSNNKFYDVVNRPTTPYLRQRYFSSTPVVNLSSNLQNTFVIKQNSFFTNEINIISIIEIDFNDGLGYQQIYFDTPITINYSDGGTKIIKTKITYSNNNIVYTKAFFNVLSQNNNLVKAANEDYTPDNQFDFPAFDPKAYVGVWYGCGNTTNKLRKPAIFVNGFDPTTPFSSSTFYTTLQNIGIDLPEELTPVNKIYERYNKDQFLDKLKEEGYDIVIFDYFDGVGKIQDNSNALVAFINYVNNEKNNNLNTNTPNVPNRGSFHENVIIGYSSGAIVIRYTLRKMEIDGINHHCRTYVSYDGEHQGANLPLGMQFYIADDAVLNSTLHEVLDSDQAKQLLKYHHSAHSASFANQDNLRTILVNELNALGFPTKTRNIGVSNAAYNGTLQSGFVAGSRLLAKKRETDANSATWVPAYKDNKEYFALNNVNNAPVYNNILAFKWPFSSTWNYSNGSKQIEVSNALPIDNAGGSKMFFHKAISGAVAVETNYTFFESANVFECFVPLVSGLDIRVTAPNLGYSITNHNLHYITPTSTSNAASAYYGYPYLKNSNPKSITPFDMIVTNAQNEMHVLNPTGGIGSILANDIAPSDLYLENRTIAYNADFEARNKIFAGNLPNYYATEPGDFVFNSGTNSVIKAGEEITFLPGFEVKAGAEFHAYIDGAQNSNCVDILHRQANTNADEEVNKQLIAEDEILLASNEINLNQTDKIIVYPNPADNEVFIIGINFCNTNLQVNVLNNLGIVVANFNANEICLNNNSFDTKLFNNGTYLLQVISENKIVSKKIIVIHK